MSDARRCVGLAIFALIGAIATAQEAALAPSDRAQSEPAPPAAATSPIVDAEPGATARLVHLGPVAGSTPRASRLRLENPTSQPLHVAVDVHGSPTVRAAEAGDEPRSGKFVIRPPSLRSVRLDPHTAWTFDVDDSRDGLGNRRYFIRTVRDDGDEWLATPFVDHPALVPISGAGDVRLVFVAWMQRHARDVALLRLENPSDALIEFRALGGIEPAARVTNRAGVGPLATCSFGYGNRFLPPHRGLPFSVPVYDHESSSRFAVWVGRDWVQTDLIERPERFLPVDSAEVVSDVPTFCVSEFGTEQESRFVVIRIANRSAHPIDVSRWNRPETVEVWTGATFEPRDAVFRRTTHEEPPKSFEPSFRSRLGPESFITLPPRRAFDVAVDLYGPSLPYRVAVDVQTSGRSITRVWSPRFDPPPVEAR